MQEIEGDSLKKNFVYQASFQILSIILPLITSPYISRILGREGVGVYSYTNSIMFFFLIFASLGISNYGNREIAAASIDRKKLSETFLGIYTCHILTTVLSASVYFGYMIFNHHYRLVFLIQSIHLFAVLLDISWFFAGIQKFRITVRRNFIVRILTLMAIFIFVKERSDVWLYVLIIALGNLIGQILVWTQLKLYIDFQKVSLRSVISHIKPMIFLFLPVVGMSIYRYMGKIMIPHLSSMSQLGLYENAEKIMFIPLSFITSIGIIFLPKVSKLVSRGESKQSNRYFSISIKYSMILAYAMSFGLIGISPVFIPVFLGAEFIDSSYLLSVISVTIIFLTWSISIQSQYLIPYKKNAAFIVAVLFGAITNLTLNLILISRIGAMGAVIATVITEFIVAIIHMIYAAKDIDIPKTIKSSSFFVIPALIMMLSVRGIGILLGISLRTVVIQLIMGAFIYTSIAGIYLIAQKDETAVSLLEGVKARIAKRK